MGNSPYYDKFLRHEGHIDSDMITSSLDQGTGWLLSDPSTWIFSRVKLNSSPKSPFTHRRQQATHLTSINFTSSTERKRQRSVSEMSNPGLIDDHCNSWTGSEVSLVDFDAYSDESSPQLSYYEDWNSWFPDSPNNFSQETLPIRNSSLSSCKRNFASTNLSDLDVGKSPSLLNTPTAPRSPQRTPRPKAQPTLSAFPPSPKKRQTNTSEKHDPQRAHKSWSIDPHVERPQLRFRSNTSPTDVKANNERRPSNLSTCTTLDNDSCSSRSPSSLSTSTTSGHLYMRSPTLTPLLATSSNSTFSSSTSSTDNHSALNAYLSTQSFFFHDDDDNSKEASWISAQCRKFQLLAGPRTRDPSTLPSLDQPPTLRAAERYYSTKRGDRKAKKDVYPAEKKMKKKKSTLALRTTGLRDIFGMSNKKSNFELFEEGRQGEIKSRTHVEEESPKSVAKKQCPKCKWALEKQERTMMVTCWCRADMCYACLRDWDFCEGTCC